jgi:hypothetical protein
MDYSDYVNRPIYREYARIDKSARNSSADLVFSSFFYKGRDIQGTCSGWDSYVSSQTRLPFDDVYYSGLTLYGGALDIALNASARSVSQCTNAAVLKDFVFSMNNGLAFNQICDGLRFRIGNCPVVGTTFCVNCNDPCKQNQCMETYSSKNVYVNPCEDCVSMQARYQVLQLHFQQRALYPHIQVPYTWTVDKHSATLNLNVSAPGTVYCHAARHGVPLASEYTVKTQGSQLAVFQAGVHSLVIRDLRPSTAYDVYCYTEDFSSHTMGLSAVRATLQQVTTDCCAGAQFTQYYPQMRESTLSSAGASPSVFSFVLDAADLGRAMVNITVVPDGSTSCVWSVNGRSSIAYAKPAGFVIGNTSATNSFVVFGSPGCYTITATLRSMAAPQIAVGVTQADLAIVSAATPVVPPVLAYAQISNSGLQMLVGFDSGSDKGEAAVSNYKISFDCSRLLVFPGASNAKCVWNSANQVQVTFGSTGTLAVAGDALSLQPNALRSSFCVGTPTTSTNCTFSSAAGSVTVAAPAVPVTPVVSLSSSQQVGNCDTITLDPTASTGSGGRAWTATWFAEFTSVPAEPSKDYAALATAIAAHLNANYSSARFFAVIPNSLLGVGSLKVTLRLRNYLDVSSQASVSTDILVSSAVPSVSIAGPRLLAVSRSRGVSLTAVANLPSCGGTPSNAGLRYTWLLYSGTTFVSTIKSVAVDPRNYKLDPFVLSSLTPYTIQVVVSAVGGGAQSTASVKLQVISGGAVARIVGGDARRVSAQSTLTLDASPSYDVDDPFNANALTYSWSCVETTAAYYGDACQISAPQSSAKSAVSLSAYESSVQTRTLVFTVVVTNGAGLSANATSSVEVYSQSQIPGVSLSAVRVKYNPQEKVILTGVVTANARAAMQWSVDQLNATHGVFLTPAAVRVPAGRTLFQQALAANTLQAGARYALRLGVNYLAPGASVSYSEVLILMNAPPSGGSLTVSPSTGYELQTPFLLQTYGWSDDVSDLPISYTIQYYTLQSLPWKLLKAYNQLPYVTSNIGRGLPSANYQVTCVATAADTLGSTASTTSFATVRPAQLSVSAVSQALTSHLTTAFALSDPLAVSQIIVAVADVLNQRNCSLVPPSVCQQLNRENCARTSQACGPCQAGYVGVAGDGNWPCVLSDTQAALTDVGGACNVSAQCKSNYCAGGVCAQPAKECPNACSGAGLCVVTNYTGHHASSCTVDDPFCSVACSCDAGSYGQDCSLSAADFAFYRSMREDMCHSLYRAAAVQDVTSDVLLNRAQLLGSILADPSQISELALYNCTYALSTTIKSNSEMAGRSDVVSTVVDTLSTVLEADALPLDLVEELNGAYESLSEGIQSSLAIGEEMAAYTTKNMRLGSALVSPNNTDASGAHLTVPQSDFERLQGLPPTQLALNVSSGLVGGDGAVGVTVFQYNKNVRKGDAATPGVGFKTRGKDKVNAIDGAASRRQLASTEAEDAGVSLELTLQNLQPQHYYVTAPEVGIVDCLRTGVPHNMTVECADLTGQPLTYLFYCPGLYGQRYNFTCPYYTLTAFCTSWDGSQYVTDDSCEVVRRDSSSTTCRCSNKDQDGRRLATVNSDLKELSSAIRPVTTPFVQLIAEVGPKDPPAVDRDSVVVIATSAFMGIMLAALFVLYRQDDQHIVQVFKPLSGDVVTSTTAVAVQSARPIPRGSSAVLALNYSFPLHDAPTKAQHGAGALTEHEGGGGARRMRHVSIEAFFNALLPKELTGQPWHKRLAEKFLAEHDWYSLFQRQPKAPHSAASALTLAMQRRGRESWAHTEGHHELKSLRWLLLAGRILNFLFFTTLLVSKFYADDGTCEEQVLEEACLAQTGLFDLGHTCYWEPTLEGACRFNKPSFDNPLALLLVAVVVTVIALPFDHLFYFVVVKLKLSTTDVATAHLKAANAKTQRQVEPLKLKSGAAAGNPHPGPAHAKPTKKQANQVKVHPKASAAVVPAHAGSQHGHHSHGHSHSHSHGGHHDHSGGMVLTHGALAGTSFYARHHELSGIVSRNALYLRAARLTLIQAKTDRVSVRKEVHTMLNDIHTGSLRLRVQPSKILTLHMFYKRAERAVTNRVDRAVAYVRGRSLPPSEFRDKIDEDTIQYVSDEVKYGRHHGKDIKRTLGSLNSDLDKEAYLLQQFLVECLPPLHRRLAALYLFRRVELSRIALSNTMLYTMFALLMLYLAFTVVYVFMAGTTIGTRSSLQWLLVVGMCFTHDLVLLQPLKIWLKYVAVSSVASSELRLYHAMLRERSRFVLTRMNGVVRNYNQLLHHANPACRAARTFPELAASRLLISLNDADLPIHVWRDSRMSLSSGAQVATQALLGLLLSPMLLLPAVTHEFVLETAATVLLNVAVVGLALLGYVNALIPIGVALVVLATVAISLLMVWQREAAARARVAVLTVTTDDMLADELDKPIEEDHHVDLDRFVDALQQHQAVLAEEEFAVVKDSRRGLSVKNHLKEKGDLYEKLVRKYYMRKERAALGAAEDEHDLMPQPLFDTAPGDITTPFKVKPFIALSPRTPPPELSKAGDEPAVQQEEETKDAAELVDPTAAVSPAVALREEPVQVSSPSKAERYVPRYLRREQEHRKRQEEEQKEQGEALEFEFSNPMAAQGDSSEEDGPDSPVRWGPDARRKPTKPAVIPPYDVASVTALLKKHSLNATATETITKPIAKPDPAMIRVPKEIQRRRAAQRAEFEKQQEQEQRRKEDSFEITFGDSDPEDGEAEQKARDNAAATGPSEEASQMPKHESVVATVKAVTAVGRSLRTIRQEQRRRREQEIEQAEQQRMKAAEEDFDVHDLLFGEDDGQAQGAQLPVSGLAAGAVEERKRGDEPAAEGRYRAVQLAQQVQRPKTSAAVPRRDRPASAVSPAKTAATAVSRAAALDAAHRAENINRLNRIVAMNNFVHTTATAAGRAASPAKPERTATQVSPTKARDGAAAAAISLPARIAPPPSRRRMEAARLREEQDRRRQQDEQRDWQMLNDDLFEDAFNSEPDEEA